VMYDLSGLREEDIMGIAADWKQLVSEYRLRQDASYLQHQGKPLVAIWGVGFNDNRNYSPEACRRLISFFKKDGEAVMLGVPYFWREGNRDSLPVDQAHSLFQLADILSPWSIGRYSRTEQAAQIGKKMIAADLAWCEQRHIAYLPVFFPGFSWQNLEKARGRETPLNAIPREKGNFLWAQAASALPQGVNMAYVAMFDEMDEGTCIFKITNNPPAGESHFATYEGLPSDYYLWLTGKVGEYLSKPTQIPCNIPTRTPAAPRL